MTILGAARRMAQSWFSRDKSPSWSRLLKARWDAAATTPENAKHWAPADNLSGASSLKADVRRKLRSRSRYECENNCYAAGAIRTVASEVIGRGPKLQLNFGDDKAASEVEQRFAEWAEEMGFAETLRLARQQRCMDGEVFCLLRTNPNCDDPTELDLKLYEADQIASDDDDEGIRRDDFGDPLTYSLLKHHPGDSGWSSHTLLGNSATDIASRYMLHYRQMQRVGSERPAPELTAALPLFAFLRRYVLATISSAEVAALYSAVLETEAPPDGSDDVDSGFFGELRRGMLLSLPKGWSLRQMTAEQPTTNFPMFVQAILIEISRLVQCPYSILAGDTRESSFSSARFDDRQWQKTVRNDRALTARQLCTPIFNAWWTRARLISGYVPRSAASIVRLRPTWTWDATEHIDPVKEAQAAAMRLQSGLSTLAEECSRIGLDWRIVAEQRRAELELYKELGLPEPNIPPEVWISLLPMEQALANHAKKQQAPAKASLKEVAV